MAPRLAASQHQLIGDMILSGTLKQADIASLQPSTLWYDESTIERRRTTTTSHPSDA